MKISTFRSLSFKLIVWYIVILGIMLLIAGLFIQRGFEKSHMNELDEDLFEVAVEVAEIWRHNRGVSWAEAIERTEEIFEYQKPYIMVVELSRCEGSIEEIISSKKNPRGAFFLDRLTYYKAKKAELDDLVYLTVEEKKLSEYPLRVVLLPGGRGFLIQVGISLKETCTEVRHFTIIMIIGGFLLLFLASLGGSYIINRALSPVKKIVKTANKITTDDLSLRIDIKDRKDEIGALVDTLNNMISRLEKSISKIKRFSGDVSHELRTPLTNIHGEIEVMLRKKRSKEEYKHTLKSVLEETENLEKIVDDLLLLARTESIRKENMDSIIMLDEILLSIYEKYEKQAGRKKISFEITELESLKIKGEETLIKRLILNLIDNAIRYTLEKGQIKIYLKKENGYAVLGITDTGIGIPEESLPYIFDRFYIVDESRSKEKGGIGLGLSIVKRIADIHGAEIEIDSKLNKGTEFRIKFILESNS